MRQDLDERSEVIYNFLTNKLDEQGLSDELADEAVMDYARVAAMEERLYGMLFSGQDINMLTQETRTGESASAQFKVWKELLVTKSTMQRAMGLTPTARKGAKTLKEEKKENPFDSI